MRRSCLCASVELWKIAVALSQRHWLARVCAASFSDSIFQGHRLVETLLSLHGLRVTFGPIREMNSKKPPQVNILSCQRLYTATSVIRRSPPTASAEERRWGARMKPLGLSLFKAFTASLWLWPSCRFPSDGWRTSPVFSSCYTRRSESDQHVHCSACFSHFSAQLCFTTRLLNCRTSKRSQSGFTLIFLSPLWWFLFVCQS